jgi:hypothetical protein
MSICVKCNRSIKPASLAVNVAGENFHPTCLSCATCGRPLWGKEFKRKDKKLVCAEPCQPPPPQPTQSIPPPTERPSSAAQRQQQQIIAEQMRQQQLMQQFPPPPSTGYNQSPYPQYPPPGPPFQPGTQPPYQQPYPLPPGANAAMVGPSMYRNPTGFDQIRQMMPQQPQPSSMSMIQVCTKSSSLVNIFEPNYFGTISLKGQKHEV